jgi:polygalacturonase
MRAPQAKKSRRGFIGGLVAGSAAVPMLASARGEAAPRSAAGPLFEVTRFGAVGDGRTSCTGAFQRAIDACGRAGGGIVLVPSGRFVSGALFLRSNVQFHMLPGAVMIASDRFEDFPPIDGRSEGIERKTHASLFTGERLENVSITGTGTVEGQGPRWWSANAEVRRMRDARKLPREADNPPGAPLRWPRPRLINFIQCQRVTVEGISLVNSPYWNVHFVYCQDVLVNGLKIEALEAQNIDGVIIDSCKQVRVTSCAIAAGSDSIAVKSGYNADGRRVGIPSEDVLITNCNLTCTGGAGISIGSETAGGIKNISISNCTIVGPRYGIQLRSPRGRGGVVERIRMSDVLFDRITGVGLYLTHFYDSLKMDSFFAQRAERTGNPETDRAMRLPVDEGTPTFREIDFSRLTFGEVPILGLIEGLPERFISGVRIRDVSAADARSGFTIRRASDVSVSGLCTGPAEGPALSAREVERLRVDGLVSTRPDKHAAIVLEDVTGAFVHDCDVPQRPLCEARGNRNRGLNLSGNNAHPGPGPR